jgi:hypothetical protein
MEVALSGDETQLDAALGLPRVLSNDRKADR